MKAMIFAAGLGTRLKPLTLTTPKALVEVGGEPMLGRILRRLNEFGVSDAVVNVHHHASKVIDYLKSIEFMNIEVSDESDLLLDTGGGLLKASRKLLSYDDSDDVIVHNADIWTDVNFSDMYRFHKTSEAQVSLLTSSRSSSRSLLFDNENRMRGWKNNASGELRPEGISVFGLHPLSFGGVHIMTQSFLRHLLNDGEENTPFSIISSYINCCNEVDIRAYEQPQGVAWFDIGKPQSLEMARQYAANFAH